MNDDDPAPREAMFSTLEHFWENYGDIERSSSYDRAKVAAEFPEIVKAWEDYKTAEAVLNAVMRGVRP